MQSQFGILIIVVGVVLVLIGILAYFGGLTWFGNLPGDINIERGNTRIYIPLVSMLLVSILLSLISYAVRRFF
ncbi:MAG TPA: DUF2905 domain-containing protein [Pyrinomonadaceae bacterium]|jgi:uncharacterized membrane protein